MRVRFTERSFADLSAILDYLSEHSPAGAKTVKRSIQRTIDLIGEFPQSGRRSEAGAQVKPVGRYPYLVYWRVIANEAWIVHIRDARRRPWEGE